MMRMTGTKSSATRSSMRCFSGSTRAALCCQPPNRQIAADTFRRARSSINSPVRGKGDDDGGNPIIDMRFQPDAQPIIREESVEHTEQKSHRGGKRHQTVYIVAARPGSLPGTGIKGAPKTAVPELPVPSVFHGYRVHAQRL